MFGTGGIGFLIIDEFQAEGGQRQDFFPLSDSCCHLPRKRQRDRWSPKRGSRWNQLQ